jgi:hypothetical protein
VSRTTLGHFRDEVVVFGRTAVKEASLNCAKGEGELGAKPQEGKARKTEMKFVRRILEI